MFLGASDLSLREPYYSSVTGMNKLYHNGKKIGTISLFDEYGILGPVIKSNGRVYDSAFIIGQEPDSMRGNYSKTQAFPGAIAELNIWDRLLEDDEIYRIGKGQNIII